jgi:hypothetical protein
MARTSKVSKVLKSIRAGVQKAREADAAPRSTVHEFEMELTPFSSYQLYGDKKYSLQNMVLKMVDYPAKIDTALDHSFDIYVDRAYTEWGAAARLISSKESGDAWFAGVSDKDFLLFAGKLFAMLNTRKPCTGDEIVQNVYRYSNKFQSRVAELIGSKALAANAFDADGYENLTLSIKTREWAEKQAAEEIEPLPVTGALMVRMTNVSSGYPCPILMGVVQKSKFARYSGNSAPFIGGGRRRQDFMDIYGNNLNWGYDEDRY